MKTVRCIKSGEYGGYEYITVSAIPVIKWDNEDIVSGIGCYQIAVERGFYPFESKYSWNHIGNIGAFAILECTTGKWDSGKTRHYAEYTPDDAELLTCTVRI